MATTMKHQPNPTGYIQVVAGASNDFLLQNISKNKAPVMLVWAATVPAANVDFGAIVYPGDAIQRAGLTGPIWARGVGKDGILSVTEE